MCGEYKDLFFICSLENCGLNFLLNVLLSFVNETDFKKIRKLFFYKVKSYLKNFE